MERREIRMLTDLRERRIKQGLTQVNVAVKVGVSLTTYQLWERQVGQPSPENLKKLEEVLGDGE